MQPKAAATLVLETFRAVEARDRTRLDALYHPEVRFHWPPSLNATLGESRVENWNMLQPTPIERAMYPRVVAANENEVVVLWQWQAVAPQGERFICPVLGLYSVRDGKFASAQMFFFDTVAVVDFLARARQAAPSASAEAGG